MKATIFNTFVVCPICFPNPSPDNPIMYVSKSKFLLRCDDGHVFEIPRTEIELKPAQKYGKLKQL